MRKSIKNTRKKNYVSRTDFERGLFERFKEYTKLEKERQEKMKKNDYFKTH